jgi:hypothetical protein
MNNQDSVLIVDDDSFTLDLIADTVAKRERLYSGTGLIWGLLISVFLWLILGIISAVLL